MWLSHSKCLWAFGIPKSEGQEERSQWEDSVNRTLLVVGWREDRWELGLAKEEIKVCPDKRGRNLPFVL